MRAAWMCDPTLNVAFDKLVVCSPPEERAAQRREQERVGILGVTSRLTTPVDSGAFTAYENHNLLSYPLMFALRLPFSFSVAFL
jgi:hypothetical protein